MLGNLLPLARRVYTVQADSPRALPAERLAEEVRARGTEASACASVTEAVECAVRLARLEGLPVCALGSLYLTDPYREAYLSCIAEKDR